MAARLKTGVVLGVLALACLGAVGAAHGGQTRVVRATPVAMARHITSLGYPYTTASCHGKGTRKHGTYVAFRCVAKGTVRYWDQKNTVHHLARSWTLWAKSLRAGWCASANSLNTCHRLTAPVYGSEDKCNSNGSYCSRSSDTGVALAAHFYVKGTGYLCSSSGTDIYTCLAGSDTETVAWTKASYGWLPTVTP